LGQLLDRLRQEDLATLRHPKKPGEAVEGRREIVTMLRMRFPGVQRHPHTQGSRGVGPGFTPESALGSERCGEGIPSGGKGGLRAIPHRLVERASMILDCSTEEGKMPLDRCRHCCAVPLPERGAPLNVGEEKGDGTGREIGHWPSPLVLVETRLIEIVAWSVPSHDGRR
jgi:hypothetical protein